MSSNDDKITSLLSEGRIFQPPAEGRDTAKIKSMEAYEAEYKKSMDDPEGYWAGRAEEGMQVRPWDKQREGK